MFYLVSYDIPDDKRRRKLAKAIKDFGDRVQYSVFECNLDGILMDKMTTRVKAIIDPEKDSVGIYTVCAACFREIRIMGTGEVTRDEDVYIL